MPFLLTNWVSLSMRTPQYTNTLQIYSFSCNNQENKPKKFNLSRKYRLNYTLIEYECLEKQVI